MNLIWIKRYSEKSIQKMADVAVCELEKTMQPKRPVTVTAGCISSYNYRQVNISL